MEPHTYSEIVDVVRWKEQPYFLLDDFEVFVGIEWLLTVEDGSVKVDPLLMDLLNGTLPTISYEELVELHNSLGTPSHGDEVLEILDRLNIDEVPYFQVAWNGSEGAYDPHYYPLSDFLEVDTTTHEPLITEALLRWIATQPYVRKRDPEWDTIWDSESNGFPSSQLEVHPRQEPPIESPVSRSDDRGPDLEGRHPTDGQTEDRVGSGH